MTREGVHTQIQLMMDEVKSEDDAIMLSAAFFDACCTQMLARDDGEPISQKDIETLLKTFYARLALCYLAPQEMPS